MNILIISASFTTPFSECCGIGDYTRLLAKELARNNRVVVITLKKFTRLPFLYKEGNVLIYSIDTDWGFDFVKFCLKIVKVYQIDVVNIQYQPDVYNKNTIFSILPLVLKIKNVKNVVTFHTLYGGDFISKFNLLGFLFFSSYLISTYQVQTKMILKYFPFLKRKTITIPIGSNISPLNISKQQAKKIITQRHNINSSFIILYFGFFYKGKGIPTLFKAIKILKENNQDFVLVMVGEIRSLNKDYVNYLKRLQKELDIQDKILWTGRLKEQDVSLFIKSSDIVVLPFDEGISLRRGSLIACIVHGKCIISTFHKFTPSLFKDGINIVLIPPKDHYTLASKIEYLLKNQDKIEFIENNVRELSGMFTWRKIASLYEKVFKRLL